MFDTGIVAANAIFFFWCNTNVVNWNTWLQIARKYSLTIFLVLMNLTLKSLRLAGSFFFVIKARSKSLFGLNWKKFVLLVA